MNKEELRSLLHEEYSTENWKRITSFVFPNVQYLQRPQDIPYNNERVSSFRQIGNVKLNDGKNLAMFEVKVAKNVNLSINRVELRKLVTPLIDQERNHGVLVIYEQGKEEYRFTFTAKSTEFSSEESGFVDKETDAKRFTYILGKNESCKTAANRFWELSSQKAQATIKDVEAAFSVERLNKEFFEKYKNFYEDFVQHITGKRFEKEKGKWEEKTKGKASPEHKSIFKSDDKQARNFVKLLLGRLVFIQFLQKKGWMGVPASSKVWKDGDREFLLNLFKSAKNRDKFHSQFLYPLFYKAFNTPDRKNDVFEITGSRVPYLNGGLFENEYPQTDKMNFPAQYFEKLLDFFGQYNFTIDENDPLDHEVGIDPEMLGHIFENLLEDNKDKGAFYTPKPIVQYMCQESLIEYLKTYLKQKKVWPAKRVEITKLEESLEGFVRKKLAGDLINDYDELLAKALKDVKICDPAIGSGAFPMGLLNEIFYCIEVLHSASPDVVGEVWGMEKWAPDLVKKNIIQHSIYGVDIDKGAVDIARLRFWLSLVVHEKEPYPLPNLDFKIMQGNSLLESYKKIRLSPIPQDSVPVDLFGKVVNPQTSIFDRKNSDNNKITDLIDHYFNTQKPQEKQKLRKQIDSVVNIHINERLEFEKEKILEAIEGLKTKLAMARTDQKDNGGLTARYEKAKTKYNTDLEWTQSRLKNLARERDSLHELQKNAERPYFLWHLFYKDVFDTGGFDIVIGNPPYIQLQKMSTDADMLQEADYATFERTGDIYCLFYELGFNILKKNGVLTYITSNKWMRAAYGEALRKYFIENANPLSIIDFGGYQVFDTATVDTNIIVIQKSPFENNVKTCVLRKGFSLNKMSDYFKQHCVVSDTFDASNSWVVLSSTEQEIKKKIERAGIPLKDWKIAIYRGILTGYNDAFIVSQEVRDKIVKASPKSAEIIRPILRGRDIQKYSVQWDGWYLITTHNGYTTRNGKSIKPVEIKDYPEVKSHLEQHWQKVESRLDQGATPYNLRSCIYMEDFFSPKIIYPEITKFINFYLDREHNYYVNNKCFIMSGENLEYLTCFLNSSLFKFCFLNNFPELLGGTRELRKVFLEKIPIKEVTPSQNRLFADKLRQIQKLKNDNKSTHLIEVDVDQMIFDCYDLTQKEKDAIGFITIE